MNYKRIFLLLFLCIFSLNFASGLGIGGEKLKVYVDFKPGEVASYEYVITNNDGYLSDYTIFVETAEGAPDLAKYFTLTPDHFEDVITGETRQFNIQINYPSKISSPGQNEARVWVKSIPKGVAGGGLSARPVVGIRFLIFVLYPWKTVNWDLELPPINLNDKKNFVVSVENLGEPLLESVRAEIDVYNLDGIQIKSLRTGTETAIKPKEKRSMQAQFDSAGLPAGEYTAITRLYWDGNISDKNKTFIIGEKKVDILNYTKLFEYKAINKFDIIVKSQWNDPIKNIYAKIDIYDREKKNKLGSFKSFEDTLAGMEAKVLQAYFDTSSFEKGQYLASMDVIYDGTTTHEDGIIRIDENINAATVTEIPGAFKITNLIPKFTVFNLLVMALLFFIIVNVYLVMTMVKKKKDLPEVDEEAVKSITELKKKYSEAYIRDMMIKKGWSKEKIDLVFSKIPK